MFHLTPHNRVLLPSCLRTVLGGVVSAFLIALSLAAGIQHPTPVNAATQSTINFQARLQDGTGAIVPDGYYNVQFKLYDASTAGTNLWTETYYDANGVTAGQDNRVRVQNGYLSVALGSQTAFPGTINWDQQLWLTMNIGGTTQTATPTYDGEMNPRLALTAVPYAFRAGQLAQQTGSYESTLGFATQTGSRNILLPDESGTICLQNSANCGFLTGASASGSYVQLQSTSPGTQQTGNLNISGKGLFGGNIELANNSSYRSLNSSGVSTQLLRLNSADNLLLGADSGSVNANIRLYTNGAEQVRIGGNGNVGIGTTNAGYKLDVNGDVNIASGSAYKIDGTDICTSSGCTAVAGSGNYIQNGTNPQTANFNVTGNGTIGGDLSVGGEITQGNAYPIYQWKSAAGVDTNWKTIANINLPTGLSMGVSFKVDVLDANGNIGQSADEKAYRYYVSILRSGGTQDDNVRAVVSGPASEYVRVVKTSNADYELQARTPNNYRFVNFTVQATSANVNAAVSYIPNPSNGSTTGTIYMPTVIHTDYTSNLNVAGMATIQSGLNVTGGLNNNSGGITNAGAISGVTTLTAGGTIRSTRVGSPNQYLELNGGDVGGFYLTASSVGNEKTFLINNTGTTSIAGIQLQTAGTTKLLVDNGGNVGIGTGGVGTANYKLDVNGDINIASGSAYKINGTNICTASGCTVAAGSGSYIQNGTSPQTANFNITGNGTIGGDLNVTGNATLFKPTTNSVTAFQIQPAGSTTPVFNVDTTNSRVGIGTATPGSALDVAGEIRATGPDAALTLYALDNSGNSYTLYSSAGELAFYSGALRATLTGSGNLGIGTNYTSPARRLDVFDSANPQMRLTQTDGTTYADFQVSAAGDLAMSVDGQTNQLVLDNGGNVGIGTTSPGYKLDVNGSFRASSTDNAVFGDGTTGGIQIGGAQITKTNGSGFQFNSSINTNQNIQTNGITRIDASGNITGATVNVTGSITGGIIYGIAGDFTGFRTSNTSNVYNGQWTKLATCTLTGQYNDCHSTALVVMYGDGTGNTSRAQLNWRVKQQAAFGSDPVSQLEVSDVNRLTADNFVSIITSNAGPTTTELWGQINGTYQSWSINPLINGGSNRAVWLSNQSFSTTLPAGTQTLAVYSDAQYNSVNSVTGYKFNGTSGATTTCSGGQFFQNAVVQGGIITGGACATPTDTGVTTVGTLNSQTKSANGAVISGTNIYLQTADATNPGLVSTGVQTFAGAKTFGSQIIANGGINNNNAGIINTGSIAGVTTLSASGTATVAAVSLANGAGSQGNLSSVDQIIGFDDLRLAANSSNTNQVYLATSGNVGIGTSSPGYKLDVNGDVNIAGGSVYRINGSQIGSTNLNDGSNLAKLNGTQTFSGANTFTNNTTVKTTGTTAFQVQNSSGTVIMNADTSNNRVQVSNLDAIAGVGSPAAITRTSRINAASGGTGSGWGTGTFTAGSAFTPAAGSVLVATVSAGENCTAATFDATASQLTISGGGLTWTAIGGASRAVAATSGNCDAGLRSFYAVVGTPASTTISVGASGLNMYAYGVEVSEYTNVDMANPVAGGVFSGRTSSSNDTFTATLGATPSSGDYKMGVITTPSQDAGYNGNNSGYVTPSGWTLIAQQLNNNGTASQEQYQTGSTSTTVNFAIGTLTYGTQDHVYGGFIIKQGNSVASDLTVGGSVANNILVKPSATFQVQSTAGTTTLSVDVGAGSVTISAPSASYTQRLCHSRSNGATSGMTLGDCAATGQADLAEFYDTVGVVEPGDIMAPSSQGQYKLQASNKPYQANAIGIISTNPTADGIIGNNVTAVSRQPVALAGRVPLKVSLENGPIAIGDPLAAGSLPGTAMKATGAGQIIGYALENYDSSSPAVSDLVRAEEMDRVKAHATDLPAYQSDPSKWPAGVGKIMAFAKSGYNNPLASAATLQGSQSDSGDLNALSARVDGLETRLDSIAANLSGLQALVNGLGTSLNTGSLHAGSLTLTGDAAIEGNLTVGGLTKLATLEVSGHFTLTGGDAPTLTVQKGAGVGVDEDGNDKPNGEVTITGNDNVGTITIVTGDNPTDDIFAQIKFHDAFGNAPQIVVSPIGHDSAKLQLYADSISKDGFSLGAATNPQPHTTYKVTYHAF